MVLGCHDLMVHDYGPGKRYASIHVEFDKDDNLRACHEVVDQIERKCLEEYGTNLVIHLDPVITDDVEIKPNAETGETVSGRQRQPSCNA